jgi:PIN domain nuclease of toxin-antitoxin system
MKYLLDTHAFLWVIVGPENLSKRVIEIVENPDNQILVSAVSFWEISLKHALGKLTLENISPENFPEICSQMDIEILPLEGHVCATYHQLGAAFHKDPFDKMLIWQSKLMGIPLLCKDSLIKQYETIGISVIW